MAFDHSWHTVLKPGEADDFFCADRPTGLNTDAVGFSPVNAWWLSELSRLIYKKDHTEGIRSLLSRNDHLAHVGLVERRFFSRPSIQAALVETIASTDNPFAVLIFRGTAGRLYNWRFNLDIVPAPWSTGGKVHRGFKYLLNTIWPEICDALDENKFPLFYTGHSMGGAIANMAASLRPPRAVYTFGAPRIGDAEFARTLASIPVFNVINARDIVTGLPPAGRWSRFVHAGVVVRNSDMIEPERGFNQAPSILADHAPLNYTAQLPVAFDN